MKHANIFRIKVLKLRIILLMFSHNSNILKYLLYLYVCALLYSNVAEAFEKPC